MKRQSLYPSIEAERVRKGLTHSTSPPYHHTPNTTRIQQKRAGEDPGAGKKRDEQLGEIHPRIKPEGRRLAGGS